MRKVGAAVAGFAVLALLGTGCGGSGGDGASEEPAAVSEVPSEMVEETPSEDPFATETEEPPVTEEPTKSGPASEIDAMAATKGWTPVGYATASEFVQDMCDSLPVSAIDGASRPQWLAEGGYMEGDGAAILQYGVPKMCPKWTSAVKQAVSGKFDRWYGNGTYVVSSEPVEGEETIPPGTYQATGKMDDCYWERTSESGEIIDNTFATSARKITVTIRSSDGQFTSEGCEVWKPVK
ncbi:hypothetical protein [Streptomyces sp. NPDC015130]|uniref:hypothetical protein n=1 Tax=Streptomyces sp. NPDC015130 TaxID=3364940 RepID=UPI003700BD59